MDNSSLPPDNKEHKVVYTERQGNVKYTYYDDGVMKITTYKKHSRIKWGRVILAAAVLLLVLFGLVQGVKALTGAAVEKKKMPKTFVFDSSVSDTAALSENTEETAVTNVDSSAADSTPEKKDSTLGIKVCIDAGHGDYDKGFTSPDGLNESERALEFAMIVKSELESRGAEVVMTRTTDENIPLGDRCNTANDAGCDFFVSLHFNGSSDPYDGAHGVEVLINNAQPVMDKTLADNILSALDAVGISQNLGVNLGFSGKPGSNYQINTDTVMPSCQIELGYITDENDNQLYSENKERYAAAIADGLKKTAAELGVTDEEGVRVFEGQLVSEGKSKIIVNLEGQQGTV